MIRRMVAWTGLPARQIVGFGDGVAVAVVSGAGNGARTGVIKDLSLRAEVVDDDTAATLGWRSMRSTVDIDCDHGRDLVRSMEVFAAHDLKGPSSSPKLPGGWGQPDRLAYLGGVITALCKGGSVAVDTSPPTRAAAPAHQARSKPTSPARPPAALTSNTAPVISPPAAAKPAPTPPLARRPAGGPVVQIAAGGSEAGARQALASLQAPGLAGLTRSVQIAAKDGKPLYRAVIGGFASRAEAASFCAALQKAGHACLVR